MVPAQSQLISGIREVLRKRLEDRVLEAMDDHECLPVDFSEIEAISRFHGFYEVLNGIAMIDEENGRLQRKRMFEKTVKKERKKEEDRFRDYLASHPDSLGQIEQGLVFKDKEVPIKCGRLDILAIDKDNRPVKIELKGIGYSPFDDERADYHQLKKYLNDDTQGPDSRVFFIAPKIHPSILYEFKDEQKTGKIRFFLYSMPREGEYTDFKETSCEDVEDPKPINWGRQARKKKSDKVRVVSKSVINDQKRMVDGLERIISESADENVDFSRYPVHYILLMMLKPKLKGKERYLSTIEVENGELDPLESLISPHNLMSSIERFERKYAQVKGYTDKGDFDLNLSKKDGAYLEKGKKMFQEYFDVLAGLMRDFYKFMVMNTGRLDEERINEMEGYVEEFHDILKEARFGCPEIKRYKAILRKKLKEVGKQTKEKIESNLLRKDFFWEELFYEFMKVKIERYRGLSRVESNMAEVYINLNPGILEAFHQEGKDTNESLRAYMGAFNEPVTVKIAPIDFLKYVIFDNLVYTGIVHSMKERAHKEEESTAVYSQEPIDEDSRCEPNHFFPAQVLLNAVYSNGKSVLSEDAKARISFFCQDVLLYQDALYAQDLTRIFSEFRLEKRLRRREDAPKDVHLRNFFDDITVLYVKDGRIPSARDLEGMYSRCKSE